MKLLYYSKILQATYSFSLPNFYRFFSKICWLHERCTAIKLFPVFILCLFSLDSLSLQTSLNVFYKNSTNRYWTEHCIILQSVPAFNFSSFYSLEMLDCSGFESEEVLDSVIHTLGLKRFGISLCYMNTNFTLFQYFNS